jgi:hypothetical protein
MRCCSCDRRNTPVLTAYAIFFMLVAWAGAPVSAAGSDAPGSRPAGRNAPQVTVLDLSGRTSKGRLVQVDLPGAIQLDADGKLAEIPAGQFVWLGLEPPPPADPVVVQWFSDPPVPIRDKPEPAVHVRLDLRDGQVLAGMLRAMTKPDTLAFEHRLLGRMDVPFNQVGRIRVQTEPPGPSTRVILPEPAAFDVLWLANGDRVEGILHSVDSDEIVVELASGQQVRTPTRSAQVIQLAAVPAPTTAAASRPAPMAAWLRLRDGQRIAASRVGWDPAGPAATFPFQGRPIVVPAGQLEGIEPVTVKWQWLTDLPAAGYEHHPGLAPPLKWQVDATAAGSRIYCDGSPVPHGLGMPAGSTIRFNLGGAYSRLLVWPILDDSAGIDGLGKARILTDGEPQWEGTVKALARPTAVVMDLAGKRELVLRVEPSDGGDVLTRFVWSWPVLVR